MKSLFYTSVHTISVDIPVLHTRAVVSIFPDTWWEDFPCSHLQILHYWIIFWTLFFSTYTDQDKHYSSVSLNHKPGNWLKICYLQFPASKILNIQWTSSEKEQSSDIWELARILSIIKLQEMDFSKFPVSEATRKQPLMFFSVG